MDRVFNEWHTCTRCNHRFNWKGHYFDRKKNGLRFINISDFNIKDINYINGKYIIHPICENCYNFSDEITIEDK